MKREKSRSIFEYSCHDRYDKYCNRADGKMKYELDKTKGKTNQ